MYHHVGTVSPKPGMGGKRNMDGADDFPSDQMQSAWFRTLHFRRFVLLPASRHRLRNGATVYSVCTVDDGPPLECEHYTGRIAIDPFVNLPAPLTNQKRLVLTQSPVFVFLAARKRRNLRAYAGTCERTAGGRTETCERTAQIQGRTTIRALVSASTNAAPFGSGESTARVCHQLADRREKIAE